ncbi:MAG: FAD:protein FMN transferase [Pseudolysinimonas sp.]
MQDRARGDQGTGPGVLIDAVAALPVVWGFEAIGAPWRIETPDALTDSQRAAVLERVTRFDRDWSRFRPDSLVTRISREPGRHRLPADAGPLLDWYRELYEGTSGRVSPLVGRTLESLGYDASSRLTPASTRVATPAWADAIAWDGEYLDTVTPVLLDVGAAGKGYLADLVSGVLLDLGVPTHVVDASGDIVARGATHEVIALEHPADPSKAIGVVPLGGGRSGGGALAASAVNRRTWGDGLHHVIDAVTGLPTSSVIATWALAPDALHADGLATALFFDADPALTDAPGVSFVRMFADGRVQASPSFPGEVFA